MDTFEFILSLFICSILLIYDKYRPYWVRRRDLWLGYNFECSCSRCIPFYSPVTSLDFFHFSSEVYNWLVSCPSCKNPSLLIPPIFPHHLPLEGLTQEILFSRDLMHFQDEKFQIHIMHQIFRFQALHSPTTHVECSNHDCEFHDHSSCKKSGGDHKCKRVFKQVTKSLVFYFKI